MYEEQTIIPNCTSYPTPNPNPVPSLTHAAQQPNPLGFGGLQDPSAFDLVGAASSLMVKADSTAYEHVIVTTSETANNVLVTTMHPESIRSFHCEVCNVSCNAKDMLEKHKLGKKHLKSVQKLTNSSAAIAPPMVTPPVATETVVNETENKMHRLLQNGAAPDTLLYCDICNVICNNQEGFQKHVASKKHSAKSIVQLGSTNAVFDATSDPSCGSQKKPEPFKCEICRITCTSNELLGRHIAGKKHLKKLQYLDHIPNPPLTHVDSQDTPPTNPMVNAESNEGETINLHGAKIVCELCGISCDTNEVLKSHMAGRKHLKKLKDSGQMSTVPLTRIASQDTPPTNEGKTVNVHETNPIVSQDTPPTNEGKTVNVHETKAVCELCGITCDTNEVLKIHITGKKHQKKLEKSEKLIGPNPASTAEPVTEPKVFEPMPEEGNSAISDGNNRKTKRSGIDEDVEAKKQKVLRSGTASDAIQTCTLCNVVCNSPTVFITHLAGQKHVAMAGKQAEAQARATGQES